MVIKTKSPRIGANASLTIFRAPRKVGVTTALTRGLAGRGGTIVASSITAIMITTALIITSRRVRTIIASTGLANGHEVGESKADGKKSC